MNQQFAPALGFKFLTPFYDWVVAWLGYGQKQREQILELLSLQDGEKLLDVGCGTGSLLITAKTKIPRLQIVGIDKDEGILKIARQKAKQKGLYLELRNSGAEKLPFDDHQFDAIISTFVFHHLPTRTKQEALAEIFRVLKNNGRFLLVDFGQTGSRLTQVLSLVSKIFRLAEAETLKDNLIGRLPVLIEAAGFRFKEAAPPYRGTQFFLATKSD